MNNASATGNGTSRKDSSNGAHKENGQIQTVAVLKPKENMQ